MSTSFVISCDTCAMRRTATCADCVVTHLLSPAPIEPVTTDVTWSSDELRAVSMLARAGLVPTLRHHEAASRTGHR
jgi:hypothetical protein